MTGEINGKKSDPELLEFNGYIPPLGSGLLLYNWINSIPVVDRPMPDNPAYFAAPNGTIKRRTVRDLTFQLGVIEALPMGAIKDYPIVVKFLDETEE
jgi:hypothetical protein